MSLRLALVALLWWAPIGAGICEARCLAGAEPRGDHADMAVPAEAGSHCDHMTRAATPEPGSPSPATRSEISCDCSDLDWAVDSRSIGHPTDNGYDLARALAPRVETAAPMARSVRPAAPPGLHSPFRYQHRPLLI